MKNIATASVLIKDVKGSILYIVERSKAEFYEEIQIRSEEYYEIGSPIRIAGRPYAITNVQFAYRDIMADFQTIITVREGSV